MGVEIIDVGIVERKEVIYLGIIPVEIHIEDN